MIAGLLVGVGLPVAGWFAIGPDHVVYAVVVQGAFVFMALMIGPSLVDVARSRYQVRSFEPRIYTLLGGDALRCSLDLVGWNRVIKNMRQAENKEPGTSHFLRETEQSETGHLLGFTATGLLVLLVVVMSYPVGALQILLVGVVLHMYPIMIQRLVRSRVDSPAATELGAKESPHSAFVPRFLADEMEAFENHHSLIADRERRIR